jgi:hypothetical protein
VNPDADAGRSCMVTFRIPPDAGAADHVAVVVGMLPKLSSEMLPALSPTFAACCLSAAGFVMIPLLQQREGRVATCQAPLHTRILRAWR